MGLFAREKIASLSARGTILHVRTIVRQTMPCLSVSNIFELFPKYH